MTNKTEVATPDTPIAGTSARLGCKTRSMTSSSTSTPANIPKYTLDAQVENAREGDEPEGEKQEVEAAASVSESRSPSTSRSRSPHTRSRSRSRSPLRSVTEEPPNPENEPAV